MNNNSVKIIPLGGLGEIGKNITAIEYKDEIIVIDCGVSFPDEYKILCSFNLLSTNHRVNFVPYIGIFNCFNIYGIAPI